MLATTATAAGRSHITDRERPRSALDRGRLLLFLLSIVLPAYAQAEPWTRQYIRGLPDSAFAAVETAPDGHKLRHLPHHDRYGHVDVAHVRNALARVTRVHWTDARHATAARAHLRRHLRALGAQAPEPQTRVPRN